MSIFVKTYLKRMMSIHLFRTVVVSIVSLCSWLGHPAWAADPKAVAADEMSAYLDFVDYAGGTIFPEQIPKNEYAKMVIIDARDAQQYGKSHIPGAVHIEWRQVLAKSSLIPKNKPVLIYCNTGTLSAQAGFALRVAGWENVRILQGGFAQWQASGGMDAHHKATSAPQH
jgi:rhodanese-related sulfurtransferase